MTHAEIDGMMDGVARAVRNYFAEGIVPLVARLDATERTLADLTSSMRERQALPGQPVEPASTPGARSLLADALAARQLARGGITV